MFVSLFLYALVVLALLIAELRDDRRAQFFFKPLAALGFILLALKFGALDSLYGQVILGGLVACAVGDVLLLLRNSEKLFMSGMAAFGVGHVLYLVAFIANTAPPIFNVADPGFSLPNGLLIVPLLFGFLVGLFVYRGIIAKLSKQIRFAIGFYTTIIYLMVFFALDIDPVGWRGVVPIAAMMFALSDMFVARDRFVKPSHMNFLAITPLYFGAQALFALSTSI